MIQPIPGSIRLPNSKRFLAVALLLTSVGILFPADFASLRAASIQVVLATDQTPGDAGVARVGTVNGGVWDRGGRVLMSGRYRPSAPGAVDRNAIWAWTGPNAARELYADGDPVPYYPMPVGGPTIAMSVPIIQPRFGGYAPPPDYWVFSSAVASRLPEIPESRACWVDRLTGAPVESPTLFVVNDLEDYLDGGVRFVRPTIDGAVIRERASAAGLPADVTFAKPGGGAVQLFFNASYFDGVSGRGGSVVWIARSDLEPVVSGRSNVVRTIAASSGMQLPSLPGGAYSYLRVLGVDPDENLLWEAAGQGGGRVLRGDPPLWTPLIEPGMPAPPARASGPSAATPVGTVGTVGSAAHGAGVFAEIVYGSSAGDLAGRAALLMHDGSAPKLFALEGESVDGTATGTRLQRFTPGGYDWPDTNLVAFYAPVRGGTSAFESQAVLVASATTIRLLARQHDPLPAPAGVDSVSQFRFPVLSAKPDGTVAFAAEVSMLDGSRREILYSATPGHPNRYEVLLQAGDTFHVATPDGPRTAMIRRFNLAYWRPGTFDQLLVSVDLEEAGTSAVILVDPTPPAAPRIEASIVGRVIRLRWPEAVAATLEAAESLGGGAWRPIEAPMTVVGGYRTLELEPVGSRRFFRLR